MKKPKANIPPSSSLSSSAASALAGNTFLRSLCGAGFPLFSGYMFNGMGIQWAATLLGCVAAALVPIPVIFYLYGARIRRNSKFAPTEPPPSSGSAPEAEREFGSSNDPEKDFAAASNAPRTTNGHEQA